MIAFLLGVALLGGVAQGAELPSTSFRENEVSRKADEYMTAQSATSAFSGTVLIAREALATQKTSADME